MTDSTPKDELMPCPSVLCGSASVGRCEDPNSLHRPYWIECFACGCRGPRKLVEQDAIVAWNTRHQPRDAGEAREPAIQRLLSVANGADATDVYGSEWCFDAPGTAMRKDLLAALSQAGTDSGREARRAALEEAVYRVLRDWRLNTIAQEDEPSEGYPLVDAVSELNGTIDTGEEELREIAHTIAAAIRALQPGKETK